MRNFTEGFYAAFGNSLARASAADFNCTSCTMPETISDRGRHVLSGDAAILSTNDNLDDANSGRELGELSIALLTQHWTQLTRQTQMDDATQLDATHAS
jgi:hypothetical protein